MSAIFAPASRKQQMVLESKAQILVMGGAAGCLSKDHEIMTPTGWVKISEWSGQDILQYDKDKGAAFFEKPQEYFKLKCDKLTRIVGDGISQELSDEHTIIYKPTPSSNARTIKLRDMVERHNKSKTKGWTGRFMTTFNYSGPGIDMTEGELRLQVAVMADGRIVKDGKDNYTQMRFSKKRKYDRLIALCKEYGLKYKDNGASFHDHYTNNTQYEVIVWPKTKEKYFTERYFSCNKEQMEIIIDEIIHWDGSFSDRCLVSTNSKETADFVQFAAAAIGIRCSIKVDDRPDRNNNYLVRVTKYKTPALPKGEKGDVELSEINTKDGFKYCFTVATGMLVLRRNNKIFITGNCGKSRMINTLREWFSEEFLFVAPTGVAALNISGMSCHKAFGLEFGVASEENYKARSKKAAMLLASDAITGVVIDEISMVRRDKLYEMDIKLRYYRKVDKPFGGLQVIAFGDGFQIKPVLTNSERFEFRKRYGSEIPFGSKTWNGLDFTYCYLPKVYRQSDPVFAKHLNNIRVGVCVPEAVNYFNSACHQPALQDAVTLTTTNRSADNINKQEFEKIKSPPTVFKALITGEFSERPVPEELSIKVGTKVMITVNGEDDKSTGQPKYVNGTVGIVKRIGADYIAVDIDGVITPVPRFEWENVVQEPKLVWVEKEEELTAPDGTIRTVKTRVQETKLVDKKIGTFMQFPIKLGYAITGHKAQGLTLEKVNIDFGNGAFTPGQAYVMLSRAKDTSGLRLVTPLRSKDIIIDKEVLNFYDDKFGDVYLGAMEG